MLYWPDQDSEIEPHLINSQVHNPHDLRQTYATILLPVHGSPAQVQKPMGLVLSRIIHQEAKIPAAQAGQKTLCSLGLSELFCFFQGLCCVLQIS